jgi:acyl-CoA dehydrogenase
VTCERLYRDLRVDRIWEGTSEIQRVIIADEVTNRGLDGVLSHGASQQPVPEPAGR